MAGYLEKGKELGNVLGRTDEYQAVKRAIQAADEDRDLTTLRSELERLEGTIETGLRVGQEPDKETAEAYESAVSRLQANPAYQRLVAAQANFDKLMAKVNQAIAQGMEEGGSSRIILA
jgi:cell fate (sporulation/competence/biofilm development) regulator YlbF (YheA/YmcA/DUF963 family)